MVKKLHVNPNRLYHVPFLPRKKVSHELPPSIEIQEWKFEKIESEKKWGKSYTVQSRKEQSEK